MESVYIKTLGCKVNTFDSQALESQFRRHGSTLINSPEAAKVVVVNTCSVTQNADREARYLARRFRREAPDAFIVVTGCYAQTDSAKLNSIDEIDLIVPNEFKEGLVTEVFARLKAREQTPPVSNFDKLIGGARVVDKNKQSHFKTASVLFEAAKSSRTRSFLKVQDGCDGFCSYCLIPYARGSSRSVALDTALAGVRKLASEGVSEIVLTGIHLGDYGEDLDQPSSLAELIEKICEIEPNIKIRLSSLEPGEISTALLNTIEKNKTQICEHFHLPLQSGNDRILKKMNRRYTMEQYTQRIVDLRAIFPNASISADVIPGFPSESEHEFVDTFNACSRLKLSSLHVFPYSKRPNTAAAKMPDHIDGNIVKARARKLRELSTQLSHDYLAKFIGQEVQILWEDKLSSAGSRLGKTGNYLNCVAQNNWHPEAGSVHNALIKGFAGSNQLLAVPLRKSAFIEN